MFFEILKIRIINYAELLVHRYPNKTDISSGAIYIHNYSYNSMIRKIKKCSAIFKSFIASQYAENEMKWCLFSKLNTS